MDNVIYSYTADQAVADGMLFEAFKSRWPQLTGGKPLYYTLSMRERFSLAALIEIWNEYVAWRRTAHLIPEEDRMFTTRMNNERVWVIDDGAAFTIMLPEDY